MTCTATQQIAHAKVNFSLSVGKREADEMHPICSKMATIALSDDLEVARLDDHSLSRYAIFWHDDAFVKSEINWPLQSDLAVRAHLELENAVGRKLPVQMKLQKRIPVGGGLAGGSADAAAMLRATTTLFDLDVDLAPIALKIGSDVPFLLNGGTAEVSGIGEIIHPLEFETTHLVLFIPKYRCSTTDVFRAFDELPNQKSRKGHNDLLLAAFEVEQRLAADFKAMQEITGLVIHLSGSGSVMFAICDNAEQTKMLAEQMNKQTTLVAIATKTCLP
jgi:4-diphosphocytidyl-2-C-methyl-D-erythritol kinase